MITIDINQIGKEQLAALDSYKTSVAAALATLENRTGAGNDFTGWLDLPTEITPDFIEEINATAKTLRQNCSVVVVAGIGGSYLGARAVIEAFANSFQWLLSDKKSPTIVFAGHNISEDYLFELTEYLKDKDFGVINISKSGTTTEPAIAFRIFREILENKYSIEVLKIRVKLPMMIFVRKDGQISTSGAFCAVLISAQFIFRAILILCSSYYVRSIFLITS